LIPDGGTADAAARLLQYSAKEHVPMIRAIGTATLITGLAAAVLAQGVTPKVNVKMGLWEMTTSSQMTGDIPMPDTSKMTPEQQAQMKAAMGAMMGPRTATTKTCMTKEKFEKGEFTDQKNCQNVITTNTSSVLEMQISCTQGQDKTTGQMHMEAPTPETLKGTFSGSAVMSGKTMKMSGTTTGKWIGADCGTVK
jgi:hypothetical protein